MTGVALMYPENTEIVSPKTLLHHTGVDTFGHNLKHITLESRPNGAFTMSCMARLSIQTVVAYVNVCLIC